MSAADVIRKAQSMRLVDEDGDAVPLSLLPPLGDAEISQFAQSLPCRLPDEISGVLRLCRGIGGKFEVDFTGRDMSFEFSEVFPAGIPIAADGFGNFWVVDLTAEAAQFAPIYFACHDPPIVLYQSDTLTEFLIEVFKLYVPPHHSLVHDVHEDRIRDVWSTNPDVLDHKTCRTSLDPDLKSFADSLDETWRFVDLRRAKPGDGFAWGRYAPLNVRRYGTLPVFAYQIRKGRFRRLFGG